MTSTLNALALAVSDSLVLSVLLKVTITTALALVAVRLRRNSRAAVRHVVLTAAFAMLAIVPLASLVVPALRVEIPMAEIASPPYGLASVEPAAESADLVSRGTFPTIAAPRETSSLPWSAIAVVVWSAGVFAVLVPLGIGLWQVRALRRAGLPWAEGDPLVASLASDLGIHRAVDVQLHAAVSGPMTSGVFRPAIVLPPDAPTWPQADLSRAIAHELEHVRRADWLSQCLARVICAIYWFHPLVWIARRWLALEAERACDDAVLRRSTLAICTDAEPTAYADQLVCLAARLSHDRRQRLLAMASRADLATRVRAVLDHRQPRGRAGYLAIVSACVVALVVSITMSPLQIVAAQTPAKKLRFDVAAIRECGPDSPPPPSGGARGSGGGNVTSSTGHVMIECVTVQLLVRKAYNDAPRVAAGQEVGEFNNMTGQSTSDHPMVRGGPDWMKSERYQIEATAPPDADRLTMVGPMLQTLLEERFRLTYHWDTEDIPVYAITVAKGGLKIKPQSCVAYDPAAPRPDAPPAAFAISTPASQVDLSKAPCGMTLRAADRYLMTGTTLADFAWSLSAGLDRPMVDKTGVTDKFNILLLLDPSTLAPAGVRPTTADPTRILRALEDQVGLKVEQTKAPLRFITIDQIQRPRADGTRQ